MQHDFKTAQAKLFADIGALTNITGLPLKKVGTKYHSATYLEGGEHHKSDKTKIYMSTSGNIRLAEEGGQEVALFEYLQRLNEPNPIGAVKAAVGMDDTSYLPAQRPNPSPERSRVGAATGDLESFKYGGRTITDTPDKIKKAKQAAGIFAKSEQILYTLAEKYLVYRNVWRADINQIDARFHPGLEYWDKVREKKFILPALVWRYRHVETFEPLPAIQRTYLFDTSRDVDEGRLVSFKKHKEMLGPNKNGILFLTNPENITSELCLSEGIETGLGWNGPGSNNIAAVGGIGNFSRSLRLPSHIDNINLLEDNDATDDTEKVNRHYQTMKTCVKGLVGQGRNVEVYTPKNQGDFGSNYNKDGYICND